MLNSERFLIFGDTTERVQKILLKKENLAIGKFFHLKIQPGVLCIHTHQAVDFLVSAGSFQLLLKAL